MIKRAPCIFLPFIYCIIHNAANINNTFVQGKKIAKRIENMENINKKLIIHFKQMGKVEFSLPSIVCLC